MNDAPANLYKYLPPVRAREVLEKLLIRFTQPSALNDDLEFQPPTKGITSREETERLLLEKMRSDPRFQELFQIVRRLASPQEADQMTDALISLGVQELEDTYPKLIEAAFAEADRKFGILSLSETPRDALSWSHYADGGRGFLIEFDPNHAWFWATRGPDDELRQLRRVTYAESLAPKYLLEATGDDVFYTKQKEWQREKEWRIIRSFDEAKVKVGVDAYEMDIMLFAVPPACILAVVAGFKATASEVEQMKKILGKNPNLSHVRLKKAVRRNKGSIEIISDVV
jgi:Protein of unknown function (DUF2971)